MANETIRYTARCKRCGIVESVEVERNAQRVSRGYGRFETSYAKELRSLPRDFTECSIDGKFAHYRDVQRVKGHYSDKIKCDARCVNAKGHNCECSCSGKNHGAGYSRKI